LHADQPGNWRQQNSRGVDAEKPPTSAANLDSRRELARNALPAASSRWRRDAEPAHSSARGREMRRTTVFTLALLAGCRQVLGIDDVKLIDPPPAAGGESSAAPDGNADLSPGRDLDKEFEELPPATGGKASALPDARAGAAPDKEPEPPSGVGAVGKTGGVGRVGAVGETGGVGGVGAVGKTGGTAGTAGVAEVGGTGGVGGSGPEPSCENAGRVLNEEFTQPLATDCWQLVNASKLASSRVDTNAGVLTLIPASRSGWFKENTGVLLARFVEGDFIAETSIRISNPNVPGSTAPGDTYSGAGLIALDSEDQGQLSLPFYYKIAVGTLETLTTIGARFEFTARQETSRQFVSNTSTARRLRICRIGALVTLSVAPLGTDTWTSKEYNQDLTPEKPRLQNRMLIGLAPLQYTDPPMPLVQADFDYLRVRQGPLAPNACSAPLD